MMKLWNGKYLDEEDLVADEFCASIWFDQRLWKEDILCSIAHVKKLATEGKLTEDECMQDGTKLVEVFMPRDIAFYGRGSQYPDRCAEAADTPHRRNRAEAPVRA